MAEIARKLVSRLRQYFGNRRREKRQRVRLPFSLSLPSPAKGLNGARRINSMVGHTLDLNATGPPLTTPTITARAHHLVGQNRRLNVKLALPPGAVEMQVIPVPYEC